MLRVEPSRHGFTWWPLGPTLAGFGLLTLTVVGALLESDVTVVAALTIGAFAWAGAGCPISMSYCSTSMLRW